MKHWEIIADNLSKAGKSWLPIAGGEAPPGAPVTAISRDANSLDVSDDSRRRRHVCLAFCRCRD